MASRASAWGYAPVVMAAPLATVRSSWGVATVDLAHSSATPSAWGTAVVALNAPLAVIPSVWAAVTVDLPAPHEPIIVWTGTRFVSTTVETWDGTTVT